MKNIMKKSLALLLVLAMLTPLTSCSEEAAEETADTANSDSSVGSTEITGEPDMTDEEEDTLMDHLPELDFNGETVTIYYPMGTGNLDAVGDIEGDVVGVAVYNRNLAVDERLNVELNWIEGMQYANETGYPMALHALVMAGDTSYDIATEETAFCFQYMLQGDFREIGHLPYLELDQPWWFTDFMENGMIASEKKYYLTGAAVLSCIQLAGCTHFNKDLFSTAFGDVEQLYTLVDEHEWTYDAVEKYSRDIFQDLDGDGKASKGDVVGVAYYGWAMINYLSSSNGISYMKRDEEGWPRLDLYNDDTVRWVDLLYHLMNADNMCSPVGECNFRGGKNLFQFSLLQDLYGSLRDMEQEHGVLPYPLIDSGNEYTNTAGTVNGSSFVIPVTTPDSKDEICGAVLEALCSESYRNVLPVWLETALKSKYSDAKRDADMIDIIYSSIENSVTLMADKYTRGESGSFLMNFLGSLGRSPDQFASYAAAKKERLDNLWEVMIQTYLELPDSRD